MELDDISKHGLRLGDTPSQLNSGEIECSPEDEMLSQADVFNTEELKSKIEKTKKQVLDLPDDFSAGGMSSKVLQDSMIPVLDDAYGRVEDIQKITRNLNLVRSEIIDPVNKVIRDNYQKIEKYSEDSSFTSKWGLKIGILGIGFSLVTLFSGFILPVISTVTYALTNSEKGNENVNKYNTAKELALILGGESIKVVSSRQLYSAASITNEVEDAVVKNGAKKNKELKLRIDHYLSSLTGPEAEQKEIISQMVYLSILMAWLENDRLSAKKFYEFGKIKRLEDTPHWIAIEAYNLIAKESSSSITKSSLNALIENSIGSSLIIINPFTLKKEKISEFLRSQISEIEREFVLADTKIVLVNASLAKIKNLASGAKGKLVQSGFQKGNIFIEDSESKVDKTYAYYRRGEHKHLLEEILFVLYKIKKSPYVDVTLAEESENSYVQDKFRDSDVDILIRLSNGL